MEVLSALRLFRQAHPTIQQFVLGFSGGRDSLVLLHALKQLLAPEQLLAVHVHHGLQEAADQFLRSAEQCCQQWQIPFQECRVLVQGSEGLEANARQARYEALAAFIHDPSVCLVTAHHQLDQALTVLMQLGRGAGLQGLVGMPALMHFAKGWHGRPLLAVSSEAIGQYALSQNLSWVEDPSNQDPSRLRNELKQQVWPPLLKTFPGAEDTIVRSSQHLQTALSLCEELAAEDLNRLQITAHSLSLVALLELSWPRQANVLRFWLKNLVKQLPNTKRFEEFLRQLQGLALRRDKRPQLVWDKHYVAYARGQVYYQKRLLDEACDQ